MANSEDLKLKLIIDAADSAKSVSEIRKAMKDLKTETLSAEEGSSAFNKLNEAAGRLKDKVDDLNAGINYFSEGNTFIRTSQGMVDVMGGVAAGISATQGAMALFGNENKDVEQTLLKVTSTMALLNGIKELSTILDDKSNAALFIQNVLRKAGVALAGEEAVAKASLAVTNGTATIAQRALNAAMNANPVMLLITAILTLVGAYAVFSDSSEDAKEKEEKLNKEHERSVKLYEEKMAAMKRFNDNLLIGNDLELAQMEMNGASKEKLHEREMEMMQENIKRREKEAASAKQHYLNITKTAKSGVEGEAEVAKAKQDYFSKSTELSKLSNQAKLAEVTYQMGLNAKAREDSTKSLEAAKKYKEELKRLRDEYEKLTGDIGINTNNSLYELEKSRLEMLKTSWFQQEDLIKLEKDRKNEATLAEHEREIELLDKTLKEKLDLEVKLGKKTSEQAKEEFKNREQTQKGYEDSIDKLIAKQFVIENEAITKRKANALQNGDIAQLVAEANISAEESLLKLSEQYKNGEINAEQYAKGISSIKLAQDSAKDSYDQYKKKVEEGVVKWKDTWITTSKTAEEISRTLTSWFGNSVAIQIKLNEEVAQNTEYTEAQKTAAREKAISQAITLEKNLANLTMQISTQRANAQIADINRVKDASLKQVDEEQKAWELSLSNRTQKQIQEDQRRQEYDNRRAEIEKQRAIETDKIKRKQFQSQKEMALVQLAIDQALAISKGFAMSGPLALVTNGLMISSFIAQFAAIASQQYIPSFAKGGLITGPGSGTSDDILANVSNGESIMTAKTTSQFAPILSALNQAGGGSPIPSLGGVSTNNPSSNDPLRIDELINEVRALNNRPIQTYVTEKSITTSQRIVANEQKRTRF